MAKDIQISFFFIFPLALGSIVLYLFRRRDNGFVTFFFVISYEKGKNIIKSGLICSEMPKKNRREYSDEPSV